MLPLFLAVLGAPFQQALAVIVAAAAGSRSGLTAKPNVASCRLKQLTSPSAASKTINNRL